MAYIFFILIIPLKNNFQYKFLLQLCEILIMSYSWLVRMFIFSSSLNYSCNQILDILILFSYKFSRLVLPYYFSSKLDPNFCHYCLVIFEQCKTSNLALINLWTKTILDVKYSFNRNLDGFVVVDELHK